MPTPFCIGAATWRRRLGVGRRAAQPHGRLPGGSGREGVFHLARLQLHRRRAQGPLDSGAAQHRRGAAAGHCLRVDHRGHLLQGLRGIAHHRLRLVRVLRARARRRHSQDAQVGRGEVRRAVLHHQGLRALLGQACGVHRPCGRRRHDTLGLFGRARAARGGAACHAGHRPPGRGAAARHRVRAVRVFRVEPHAPLGEVLRGSRRLSRVDGASGRPSLVHSQDHGPQGARTARRGEALVERARRVHGSPPRSVRVLRVAARRRADDTHDPVRLAQLDHVLERRIRNAGRLAQRARGDYRHAASLVRERCGLRRPHPSREHHVRREGHCG